MDPLKNEELILKLVQEEVANAAATMNPRVIAGPVSLVGSYPDTKIRIEVLVSDRGREDIELDLWYAGRDGTIHENGDLLMDVSLMLLEAQ